MQGSGDKSTLNFVLAAGILQSIQITERLIKAIKKIPTPHECAGRHSFRFRVMEQVSFDARSVREAGRSAAGESGYPDMKPQRLKIVETFVKDTMC